MTISKLILADPKNQVGQGVKSLWWMGTANCNCKRNCLNADETDKPNQVKKASRSSF